MPSGKRDTFHKPETCLPLSALDGAGYIIDQSRTQDIPFGRKGSPACGCGWIATFNLHHWRGDDVSPWETARRIHRISPLSGRFGANVFCLWFYLLFHGFHPWLRVITKHSGNMGDAGIIMYKVRRGGHYVAYEKLGEGEYRFYNAIYGLKGHSSSVGDFMAARSRWPLAMAISVKKKT